ncbi:MAG: glycosyltransferase family 4 protein, partial [Verrucomicrobiales bacterium]
LHEIDPAAIRVLPVAPKQNEFEPNRDDSSPHILFVGQLLRGKGVDLLLRALALVRERQLVSAEDWTCTIAGEGSHLDACQALAEDLELTDRVQFAGRLSRDELAAQYQSARLGVVPSVWPEPMGMVGLEFMWAALPVVAFDAGGISHWLEDGRTGYLAAPKDIAGLADHITKLLEDPDLAAQMGRRARRVAEEKYNHRDYIDRLLQILGEAAGIAPAGEEVHPARIPEVATA